MAKNIQTPFQTTGDTPIASYSWTDIVEGTGYFTLYGALENTSEGIGESLVQNTIYSDPKLESGTGSEYTIDGFEVTFNSPHILNGKVICNIPFGHSSDNAGTPSTAKVTVNMWKNSTLIGTAISDTFNVTYNASASTWAEWDMKNLTIDLDNVLIKEGESLKFTLSGSTVTYEGGTQYYRFAADPANRATGIGAGGEVTQMSFYIPEKLNL